MAESNDPIVPSEALKQEEKRGSIAFFTSYRPPVPLDIYSCSIPPKSTDDEVQMTDGVSYNYNGQVIPPAALKTILNNIDLDTEDTDDDVDSGRLSGLIFVSERSNNLETLHIALRYNDEALSGVKTFNFAELYRTYNDVRMEDSGCIAGNYIVYVTTKDPALERRQPWTSVYKTDLVTGQTDRLTPLDQADLNPSASPDGKRIAVASFEARGGWHGEIENMKTDIYVMDVEGPLNRKLVVEDGGWPSWGSNNVLFFHRKIGNFWAVFRADISDNKYLNETRVTPITGVDALTPSAIDETTVAVVTVRHDLESKDKNSNELHYRHVEIFDSTGRRQPIEITRNLRPNADHFNPFIVVENGGEKRIGYHRCRTNTLVKEENDIEKSFGKLHSPDSDIGLFRVSGAFPTFSRDGSKLAFVDNEFKTVWVADGTNLYPAYETKGADSVFSTVWNQDPQKDILYICMGPSFDSKAKVNICAVPNVSSCKQRRMQLTKKANNAFPSTNPEGTRLVYRSSKDHDVNSGYKNLYIMEDASVGEYGYGKVTRLTEGKWIDTHCQWSPSGDWIVFSSTRDKPDDAPAKDNGLDPGYYAIFLVQVNKPDVVVRVCGSGNDLAGHVNHPFFSPDGTSIVFVADIAGVSVDPISLPHFLHSVRPYGDIFVVDIDKDDIYKNENVKEFKRMTHSRYENSTGTWTIFSTHDRHAAWNQHISEKNGATSCPRGRGGGRAHQQVIGYLSVPKRCRS